MNVLIRTLIMLSLAISLFLSGCASQQYGSEAIAAAINNPARTEAHKERDARSKPQVILELLDLQPGDKAIDIFGGSGYYADMMAALVGPDGEVLLHNNKPYKKWVDKELKTRYIDNQVAGVTLHDAEVTDLRLQPNSLDAALMVMSYHDLYFYSPSRGWNRTDTDLFFGMVRDALKPGGRLVIVDHAAKVGSGKAPAQNLHRIDEVWAQQDIEAKGFTFIESNDALRNPDDPRTKMVFNKSIRGQTDRFILVFQK